MGYVELQLDVSCGCLSPRINCDAPAVNNMAILIWAPFVTIVMLSSVTDGFIDA